MAYCTHTHSYTHSSPTPSMINVLVNHFPRSSVLPQCLCVISIVSISLKLPHQNSLTVIIKLYYLILTDSGGGGQEGGWWLSWAVFLSTLSSVFRLWGVDTVMCWSGSIMQVRTLGCGEGWGWWCWSIVVFLQVHGQILPHFFTPKTGTNPVPHIFFSYPVQLTNPLSVCQARNVCNGELAAIKVVKLEPGKNHRRHLSYCIISLPAPQSHDHRDPMQPASKQCQMMSLLHHFWK